MTDIPFLCDTTRYRYIENDIKENTADLGIDDIIAMFSGAYLGGALSYFEMKKKTVFVVIFNVKKLH